MYLKIGFEFKMTLLSKYKLKTVDNSDKFIFPVSKSINSFANK